MLPNLKGRAWASCGGLCGDSTLQSLAITERLTLSRYRTTRRASRRHVSGFKPYSPHGLKGPCVCVTAISP